MKKIKRGDLLLIKSKFDPVGCLIRFLTNSQFNHVAWILDSNHIIDYHYGIVIRSINKYLNKNFYEIKIVRIKKIKKQQLNKAIEILLRTRKKISYFKLILTFILLYFKYEGTLPKNTCSGSIAKVLYKVGFKFNNKKPILITPEDINKSIKVREIK